MWRTSFKYGNKRCINFFKWKISLKINLCHGVASLDVASLDVASLNFGVPKLLSLKKLDDASLGHWVTWMMCSWDYAPPGWCTPWMMHSLDDTSLEWSVPSCLGQNVFFFCDGQSAPKLLNFSDSSTHNYRFFLYGNNQQNLSNGRSRSQQSRSHRR
jgi:hypothetical protein